jgi:hypothetical protein
MLETTSDFGDHEVTVDELDRCVNRVHDVADRAHAGLAAICRRWPIKHALVIAAMLHTAPEIAPETRDPRADLRTLVCQAVADICEPRSNCLVRILASLRTDPELPDALRASGLKESRAR